MLILTFGEKYLHTPTNVISCIDGGTSNRNADDDVTLYSLCGLLCTEISFSTVYGGCVCLLSFQPLRCGRILCVCLFGSLKHVYVLSLPSIKCAAAAAYAIEAPYDGIVLHIANVVSFRRLRYCYL